MPIDLIPTLTFRVRCTWIYQGEDTCFPAWILVRSLIHSFTIYLCIKLYARHWLYSDKENSHSLCLLALFSLTGK